MKSFDIPPQEILTKDSVRDKLNVRVDLQEKSEEAEVKPMKGKPKTKKTKHRNPLLKKPALKISKAMIN